MLREVPASIRFLSVEPMTAPLGKVDLTGIHWVISGGESGPGARPMRAEWLREVRDPGEGLLLIYPISRFSVWRHDENVARNDRQPIHPAPAPAARP